MTTTAAQFSNYDVVRYDTGTEYLITGAKYQDALQAAGWKNGKPFGATRFINGARCTLIGKATRPQTSADAWRFEPTS